MAEPKELTALVIDDEPGIVDILVYLLEEEGIKTDSATSTQEGMELLRKKPYNNVFTDLYQNPTGVDVYRYATDRGAKAYIMSGGVPRGGDPVLLDQARKIAGNNFWMKPFDLKKVYEAIGKNL